MRLLLGTKNPGKIKEIKDIFSDLPALELLTFTERPFSDVLEDGQTFAENARKKAYQISAETGLPVLAEDSGLEVDVLGGAPGVESARFAGAAKDDRKNIEKLLHMLESTANRRARFRCVVVLYLLDGREFFSEGVLEGRIAHEPRGTTGFGYDPIFIPKSFAQTLAELGPAVKNQISHRRRALEGLKPQLIEHCLRPARRR